MRASVARAGGRRHDACRHDRHVSVHSGREAQTSASRALVMSVKGGGITVPAMGVAYRFRGVRRAHKPKASCAIEWHRHRNFQKVHDASLMHPTWSYASYGLVVASCAGRTSRRPHAPFSAEVLCPSSGRAHIAVDGRACDIQIAGQARHGLAQLRRTQKS